jgi:hypothetical protein
MVFGCCFSEKEYNIFGFEFGGEMEDVRMVKAVRTTRLQVSAKIARDAKKQKRIHRVLPLFE